MKKLLFVALLTITTTMGLDAQKFGHLNSALLLTDMPEIKTADTQLGVFQDQLVKSGQALVTKFEDNYKKYQVEAQSGSLTGLQAKNKEAALQAERGEIQKYDRDMQQKLMIKREALYKPILDRVKVAIETVGKANGYTMIFDTSIAGAIVHATETQDVIALVKTELGL